MSTQRRGFWRPVAALSVTTCLIAATLGTVTPAIAASTTETDRAAPQPTSGVAPLADCVRSGRGLLVVFLIDESGSLKETDPANQRIAAVKTALDGLASFASADTTKHPGNIEVQLDGFSVAFDPVTSWSRLEPSTVDDVKSDADQFNTRNTGQDTDYYVALDGARQALSDRAAAARADIPPCKAILWFTDGRYDVIDRLTPEAATAYGATKDYAPDIRLDQPAGGLQLIARGKELLCQPGGLVDRLHSEEVVTIAVSLDIQINPDDRTFLTAVATGQGCGTPSAEPHGIAVATQDLAALVFSFDAVANSAAGGTPISAGAGLSPCPGSPCAAGSREFHVDRSLTRVHALVATGTPTVSVLLVGPNGKVTLEFNKQQKGTVRIGTTEIRFVWTNETTCSLDALVGDDAIGNWSIVLVADPQLTVTASGSVQLHVYTDAVPKIVTAPTIQVGRPSEFDVGVVDGAETPIPQHRYRHVTLDAAATNPIDGTTQPIDVHRSGGRYQVTYPSADRLPSVVVIQLTILIVTIDGIELVPIQRSYRVPVKLPPKYPQLLRPQFNLRSPAGTTGNQGLRIVGGQRGACVWIDTVAPTTQTPNTDVSYTGPSSRRTCLHVKAHQPRSIGVSVTATPAAPGTVRTSIVLNIVIVHVHIKLLIPVNFTLTTVALPKRGGDARRIVSLGDSYSSGEANPPFDVGTDTNNDRCHRSSSAWPRLLGVSAPDHLACSGAKTQDLFSANRPPPDNVSQIQHLKDLGQTGQPIEAVTITIGGNDVGFSSILKSCYLHSCLKHPEQDRIRIGATADDLITDVLPAVKAAAPTATIYLTGYPRLFPKAQSSTTRCGWLDTREREILNDLADELDTKERQAARTAHVEYVSVLDALDGHELCSHDPWLSPVSGQDCNPLASAATRTFCGHPLPNGQAAIARIVRRRMQSAGSSQTVDRTRVLHVRPVDQQTNPKAGYTVTQEFSDAGCDPGSEVTPGAYRCFGGHFVFDPCWQVSGTEPAVVCLTEPWSTELTKLRLTSTLEPLEPSDEESPAPWGVELASGERCVLLQGSRDSIGNEVVDYYCNDALYLLRGVDRHRSTWTLQTARYSGGQYTVGARVAIRTAWLPDPSPAVPTTPTTDSGDSILQTAIDAAAAQDPQLRGVTAGALVDGADTSLWELKKNGRVFGYGVFLYNIDNSHPDGYQELAAHYATIPQACTSEYAPNFVTVCPGV